MHHKIFFWHEKGWMRLFLLIILFFSSSLHAFTDEEMSEEIYKIFNSIQLVILDFQPEINSENSTTDLSSSQIISMSKLKYKEVYGVDFEFSDSSRLKFYQGELLLSAELVIDEYLSFLDIEKIGFKGFITSVLTRRIAGRFSEKVGISIKFTTFKENLRNKVNAPDLWEAQVLYNKFNSKEWPKGLAFYEYRNDFFRWMKPIHYSEACLNCHGMPQGEIDITGYKKEGMLEGDLAGAFSLIIYK